MIASPLGAPVGALRPILPRQQPLIQGHQRGHQRFRRGAFRRIGEFPLGGVAIWFASHIFLIVHMVEKYLNLTVLSPKPDLEDNGLVLQFASTGVAPAFFPKPQHELPPLILHPIAGYGEALQEGSAADAASRRTAVRRLEVKMLCCLGKDLNRWLEQCLEFAAGDPDLGELREGHWIDLLVEDPPEGVIRKMQTWGVSDFRTIFARALGLTVVFPDPPAGEQLSETFVRDFAVYADALYRARRQALPATAAEAHSFRFEVYASGEYARLLEQAWGL